MKRRKNASLVLIPQDLIEAEVLTKLPLRSLARFKSVSKHWNSLISSVNFMKLQVQQQVKISAWELFALQIEVPNEEPIDYDSLVDHTLRNKGIACAYLLIVDKNYFSFQNSCGYLDLILAPEDPNNHTILHSGLGFDFSSNNHKIVVIRLNIMSLVLTAYVSTLEINEWRILDLPLMEPNMKDRFLVPSHEKFGPAQMNNHLHWILGPDNKGDKMLLTFDLAKESFSVLPLPGYGNGDNDVYLFAKSDDGNVLVGQGKEMAMYQVLAPTVTPLSKRSSMSVSFMTLKFIGPI